MLTSKQRATLRGIASTYETIFQVGKGGISDTLVQQVSDALAQAGTDQNARTGQLPSGCQRGGAGAGGKDRVRGGTGHRQSSRPVQAQSQRAGGKVLMQRIGLFGGSFNPIHNGHLHLAKAAKEGLGLDKVVLIPANVSPFKQDAPGMASGADRLAMCRLAAETLSFCEVDSCELERSGVSYTVDTVRLSLGAVSGGGTGAAGGQRYVSLIHPVALLAGDPGNGCAGRGFPHDGRSGTAAAAAGVFIAIWQNFFV